MKNLIQNPDDLRTVLLSAIQGVLEQKVNVMQANAIASLSSEIHKSIRLEWDMKTYSNNKLKVEKGAIIEIDDEKDAIIEIEDDE